MSRSSVNIQSYDVQVQEINYLFFTNLISGETLVSLSMQSPGQIKYQHILIAATATGLAASVVGDLVIKGVMRDTCHYA